MKRAHGAHHRVAWTRRLRVRVQQLKHKRLRALVAELYNVDERGLVYVPDALFDNFQIFDSEGSYLFGIGEQGDGPGQFWMPSGVATGPDNLIVVADSYNRRVQVFQYINDMDSQE